MRLQDRNESCKDTGYLRGLVLFGLEWPRGNQNGATNYTEKEVCLYTDYEAAYCSRSDKFNIYLKAVTYRSLLKLIIISSLV